MVRYWESQFRPRRVSASICFLVCVLLSTSELLGQATPCCGQQNTWQPNPWNSPNPNSQPTTEQSRGYINSLLSPLKRRPPYGPTG